MCHFQRSSFAIVLFLASAALAAEPPALATGEAKAAPPAGGTSPQDVFEIFRKAVVADDWTTALAQFDEPSRQFIIVGYAAPSMMGVLGDQGKEIARAHLTDEQKFTARITEVVKLSRTEQYAAAPSLAGFVKDAPALCQKMIALFREKKLENWMLDLDKATLKIRKETDESAEGMILIMTPRGGGEDMNFRKINGRWFLNYNG